jgi:TBC1 domain family member 2
LREETLTRKREEYADLVSHYFGEYTPRDTVESLSKKVEAMSSYETANFRQIRIDVIRTQPEVVLFSLQPLQVMQIRILFIWSMRHPASAYVQGINDLAAPLLLVFLCAIIEQKQKGEAVETRHTITTT